VLEDLVNRVADQAVADGEAGQFAVLHPQQAPAAGTEPQGVRADANRPDLFLFQGDESGIGNDTAVVNAIEAAVGGGENIAIAIDSERAKTRVGEAVFEIVVGKGVAVPAAETAVKREPDGPARLFQYLAHGVAAEAVAFR